MTTDSVRTTYCVLLGRPHIFGRTDQQPAQAFVSAAASWNAAATPPWVPEACQDMRMLSIRFNYTRISRTYVVLGVSLTALIPRPIDARSSPGARRRREAK